MYFESLPKALARDPRVLLVYGINGGPLPHELGGPVRLWAPFLQGYKSVKWLRQIRCFVKDPLGIKRLLGQSKTSILAAPGQETAHVVVPRSPAARRQPTSNRPSLPFGILPLGGRGDGFAEFTNEVQHQVRVLPWDTDSSLLRNGVRLPAYVPRGRRSGKLLDVWVARHRRSRGS